jgi:uncharacterized DUF497 family protein
VHFEWDATKSDWTLRTRGFDFEFASRMFDAWRLEVEDTREDYGERRIIALGEIDSRSFVVVYTMRTSHACRIISARRANARETSTYRDARPADHASAIGR